MFVLSKFEQMLLDKGFDNLSHSDKNFLIISIAEKENKLQYEINPKYILDYHKQLKIDVLNEICEEKIIGGFTSSNGHTYRCNRDDQMNMIGKWQQLLANESIKDVSWKTEDEGYISHTREEWLKIYNEAYNHKEAQILKYNMLKRDVLLATNHDEIVAIEWK